MGKFIPGKKGNIHGLKDLWILLMYDGGYVGIVIIIFCISSSGSLTLKLRTSVSLVKVSLVRRLECEDTGQGRLNSGLTF